MPLGLAFWDIGNGPSNSTSSFDEFSTNIFNAPLSYLELIFINLWTDSSLILSHVAVFCNRPFAGRTKTAIFGISLGIAVIVAYVVFKLKKDVIDKMMSNYDIDN